MRLSRLKAGLFLVVIGASVGAVALAQGQAQGQAGQAQGRGQGQVRTPQNLQVLPKDWTIQQVQQQMRGFAAALGVECSHCHVGTMQERSKDDNPKKGIARKMILLTAAINNDHLKGVGDAPAAGAAKVTCFTCHRGAIKPLNAPGGGGVKP
jgi:hypothetical protein